MVRHIRKRFLDTRTTLPALPAGSRNLRRLLLGPCALVLSGIACSGAQTGQETTPAALPPATRNTLYVAPDDVDFSNNPRLREVVAREDYSYFRFINLPFATEVCRRFNADLPSVPDVNLHGDAHLGQFAVTDHGRGLSDFDHTTAGPPVIDLVRFGASLELAAHERGWQAAGAEAVLEFLDAYVGALGTSAPPPPEPELVVLMRGGFTQSTAESLAAAESLMISVPGADARAQAALDEYAAALVMKHRDLGPGYFQIKVWGRLASGIGSALDEKYLFTLEGPSQRREDDVLLEAKRVRPLMHVPCVRSSDKEAPIRILDGQARIAYEPYQLGGYVTVHYPEGLSATNDKPEDRTFWLHEWDTQYVELTAGMLRDPRDLTAIARDAGYQLGRGHTRTIADPHEQALRDTTAAYVVTHRGKISSVVHALTAQTIDAAQRYRAALGK